jgi:Holliday junction resolvase
MSRAERDKGSRGELEVAAIFRSHGFDCDRTPNSGGLRIRGDLYGTVPAHVEVKRQETLRLPLWLRQAAAEAEPGTMPVVAFRQNHGAWYAALPLHRLAELLGDLAELRDRSGGLRDDDSEPLGARDAGRTV